MRLFSSWRMWLVFNSNLHSYMNYRLSPTSLTLQNTVVLNTAASVYFPVAFWARGQKVSEAMGQVASEKEQQRIHPLEIYIMRWVSMTEWINAVRVPKVKDRGILERISLALFCSLRRGIISTMTCSETFQVRLTQRDIFVSWSVPFCSLWGQSRRCYTPSG